MTKVNSGPEQTYLAYAIQQENSGIHVGAEVVLMTLPVQDDDLWQGRCAIPVDYVGQTFEVQEVHAVRGIFIQSTRTSQIEGWVPWYCLHKEKQAEMDEWAYRVSWEQVEHMFYINRRVRVLYVPHDHENGWPNVAAIVGSSAMVSRDDCVITDTSDDGCVRVLSDQVDEQWWFPWWTLELLEDDGRPSWVIGRSGTGVVSVKEDVEELCDCGDCDVCEGDTAQDDDVWEDCRDCESTDCKDSPMYKGSDDLDEDEKDDEEGDVVDSLETLYEEVAQLKDK